MAIMSVLAAAPAESASNTALDLQSELLPDGSLGKLAPGNAARSHSICSRVNSVSIFKGKLLLHTKRALSTGLLKLT